MPCSDRPAFLGRARPEIGKEVRHLPAGSRPILYRVAADGVEIVRVVHGWRNPRGPSLAADGE